MNDNNGNLFQKILECDESEIDSIVTEAIEKADENAQSIEQLGFTNLFMKIRIKCTNGKIISFQGKYFCLKMTIRENCPARCS